MIVIFTLAQNTATTSSAQLRLTLMTWFLPRRASGLVKAPPAIFSLRLRLARLGGQEKAHSEHVRNIWWLSRSVRGSPALNADAFHVA
jgi:hypothetical protein